MNEMILKVEMVDGRSGYVAGMDDVDPLTQNPSWARRFNDRGLEEYRRQAQTGRSRISHHAKDVFTTEPAPAYKW